MFLVRFRNQLSTLLRKSTPNLLSFSFCLLWTLGLTAYSHGQYPKVSKKDFAQAQAKFLSEDQRSDVAFLKAQPDIESWSKRGKPYLPGAARPQELPQSEIPAFPGAWGGGMYTFGGRGGRVFVVKNLNDRGPGSFREVCEAGGPRIVVFNVAGIITLKEVLRIRAPYITISGATAPGNGVCIAGDTVELETHDVIIRHLRFRRGSTWVGGLIYSNPTESSSLQIDLSDEKEPFYAYSMNLQSGKINGEDPILIHGGKVTDFPLKAGKSLFWFRKAPVATEKN